MDFFSQDELPLRTRRMFDTILNISIASLGGVVAGVSISRRRNSSLFLTRLKLKKHTAAYIDHNLPSKWAISCGGFVGVVDIFVRWICPVTDSLNYVTKNGEGNEEMNQVFGTVGDFTFGGAVAGALFKGSAIRSTNKRLASIRPKFQGVLTGMFPGMVLGCVAGICSLSFTFLQKYIQDMIHQQELLEEEEAKEILPSGSDEKNEDE